MSDDFIVSTSNESFSQIDSDDDAPFRCEVCAIPLEYSGRGRHPKRCSEHKTSKSSSSIGAKGNLKALEPMLADTYRGMAMLVSMADELAGMEIAHSADKLAHSWIVLAETDPKVAKFLKRATTGTGWGGVMMAHLMVALPIADRKGWLDFIPSKKRKQEATT